MTTPDFQKLAVSGDCGELVNDAFLAYPVKKDFLIMLHMYQSCITGCRVQVTQQGNVKIISLVCPLMSRYVFYSEVYAILGDRKRMIHL